jgi:hypothetical protein
MLMQSLMEMELVHRQEELEHLELERAMALSLAVEEERVRRLMADEKESEGAGAGGVGSGSRGSGSGSGTGGSGESDRYQSQYDSYASNAHASVADQSEAKVRTVGTVCSAYYTQSQSQS